MFCPRCGASASVGTRFCATCGAPLAGVADAGANPPGAATRASYSTVGLFFSTIPYVFLRVIAYAAFGLALVAFLGLMGGVGYVVAGIFQGAGAPLGFVGMIAFMGVWALAAFAQRYVLYLIKAAHVAVITEIITRGGLPPGANQVSFGKEKVLKHFGSTAVLFAVDQLVAGSVRQVLRWLSRTAGFLGSIPGMGLILSLVRRILWVSANYIDEAVMSYIVSREDQDVWQAAADGVVLYAQSWRHLLMTAAVLVMLISVGWVVGFFAVLLPLLSVARALTPVAPLQSLYGFIALVIALIVANALKWALVDPVATVAMVASYTRAIEGQAVSQDLKVTLLSVSGKLRELTQRASTLSAGSFAGRRPGEAV